ncbi:MAG TPA: hypothetical protein VJK52_03395 [Candidatus Nanoarchaeia archaeon]|nr:hypothetical protein [Candidatus Nanoarchaeia archaeon]
MAQTSSQQVMVLGVILALVIIGGTFLVLQEVRNVQDQFTKLAAQPPAPAPPRTTGMTGEVTIYVIAQPQQ